MQVFESIGAILADDEGGERLALSPSQSIWQQNGKSEHQVN